MNKLDAEREKQMSSRAAVEYLRPNKSPPIYIHKNIVNFKTSCLISSLAERRKNIFKQYMDFQEILDEDIEGGIYNRRIPLSFTIFQNETMRKYSNEFSSGCTLHEKIPQEKYSSLVTPVNKTIKKYKSTYNRSKKPLRGFRSQLTRTGGK